MIKDFWLTRKSVLAAALVMLSILLIDGVHQHDMWHGWERFNVPTMSPPFADMRSVTYPPRCVAAGRDPYRSDMACDPYNRPFVYPPIWLKLDRLGIKPAATVPLSMAISVLLWGGFLYLFRTRGIFPSLIVFLALLSFPLALLLERCNIEEVIFLLFVFVVPLLDKRGEPAQTRWRAAWVVLLTVLKIYPLCLSAIFIRQGRRLWLAASVAVASGMALYITAGKRLHQIGQNNPHPVIFSFGSFAYAERILSYFKTVNLNIDNQLPTRVALVAIVTTAVLGSLAIWFGASRHKHIARLVPLADSQSTRGMLAIGGAVVYCFATVLASSYAYRLVFLFALIAFLLDNTTRTRSRYSVLFAALLVAFMWSTGTAKVFVPQFVLEPAAFLLCSTWLGACLFAPAALLENNNIIANSKESPATRLNDGSLANI